MARRVRYEASGAYHHVVPKGNNGARIVVDDADRLRLLRSLFAIAAELGWSIRAWSLLDTHLHLLVATAEPNLGAGMKRLLGGYSRGFHLRHGGEGSLFLPRFWSKVVLDEAQLLRTLLYVDLNPVAAGLADHPRGYRWCSYADGEERAWPDGLLGDTSSAARATYAEIVDEACARLRGSRFELPVVVAEAVSRTACGSRPPSD